MKISNNLLFCNQLFSDIKETYPVVINLNNVDYIGVKFDLEKEIDYISVSLNSGDVIMVKPNGDINDFFIELAKHCNVCA